MTASTKQLIDELTEEISVRQNAIHALHALDGVRPVPAPEPTKLTDRTDRTHLRVPRAPKALRATPSRAARPEAVALCAADMGTFSPKLTALVRKLPEPITTEVLISNGVLPKKSASNYLVRTAAKGWMKKAARGQYVRTSLFGNADGVRVARVDSRTTATSAAQAALDGIHREMRPPVSDE